MNRKITVSGVGCCLVDRVYNNISFNTADFFKYRSKNKGDGGLTPGQLVFTEEFEKFSGENFSMSLNEITRGKTFDKINIGGPGIVAMIHAAQLLDEIDCSCRFYGCGGNDNDGEFILSALEKTPVLANSYKLSGKVTPSTIVLSDPDFDNGHGERIFINSIGAAWDYSSENLDEDFFASDLVVFGGTALVPSIHDQLTELLEKAKSNGCITVVNTVYDFRNEKANPEKRWPLGKNDASYQYIDLLITDFEEALRLSGTTDIEAAIQFFSEHKTGAVIITNGAKNIRVSVQNSNLFQKPENTEMPVSKAISDELKQGHPGDTTGCGDNFVGGVISSLVLQLQKTNFTFDLTEACMWGVVSGGFSCFYMGGTFFENKLGEKRKRISTYYEKYKRQLSGRE